jgi:guanylate kinase
MFVLSGPSGAGKTALVDRLRQREPDVHYTITATTRPPRAGEEHGVHYFFYSEGEFLELERAGDLLEFARVPPGGSTLYGTPRPQVTEALARGRDVLANVDVQGAASIRARIPNAILIFLKAPDQATLRRRLEGRGSERPEQIEARINNALLELGRADEFDYCLVNEDGRLDDAVSQVVEIMRRERARHGHRVGDV